MRFTPSSPLSSSSCFVTISRSTSDGAAPRQLVFIMITGWRTSGAIWIGTFWRDTQPNSTIIKTIATTAVGLSMERRIKFIFVNQST